MRPIEKPIQSFPCRGEFVRGFFHFLQAEGHDAASLHGGSDGFEGELSDVDFVVGNDTFADLPKLTHGYAEKQGWRLCQILRHETTAAFCVCSRMDDPGVAVALDACSDYQRNSTVFLKADKLLADRRPLPWGGYGLSAGNELKYRFAKAAAKGKDPAACEEEFRNYPESAREECASWLGERWNVDPGSWKGQDLDAALEKLRGESKPRPSLRQPGSAARIARRILQPAGLLVVAGPDEFDAKADRLQSVFGHLYFRRFRKAGKWQPGMLKDLIASTLIVIPDISSAYSKLVPPGCLHRLDSGRSFEIQCETLATHLHQRCIKREFR